MLLTNPKHISLLIFRFLEGPLSAAELAELEDWKAESPDNQQLFEELTQESTLAQAISDYHPVVRAEVEAAIYARITQQIPALQRKPLYRHLFFRVAVAASIIGLLLVMGYLFLKRESSVVNTKSSTIAQGPQDVKAPETNRAMITLADGRTIYLDSAANGELLHVDGVQVVKTEDGKIVYESSPLRSDESRLTFNTLSNPRGSKVIDITLSDGTRVWLNAGSSLRYPASFAAARVNRQVEITGEAYFEVAPDANKPFYVRKDDLEVKVLGTHFNINAYEDEQEIKVTLLEGKVEVTSYNSQMGQPSTSNGQPSTLNGQPSTLILNPGQQAIATHDSRLTTHAPDLEQVMAWKNGQFLFGAGMSVEQIMRQLEKWYDVDVIWEGKVSGEIGGSISRSVNISQVLKILESAGALHYEIQGNKVIIRP